MCVCMEGEREREREREIPESGRQNDTFNKLYFELKTLGKHLGSFKSRGQHVRFLRLRSAQVYMDVCEATESLRT